MTTLNIKRLTVENWHEPDSTSTQFAQLRPGGAFTPMTGDDWARPSSDRLYSTACLSISKTFMPSHGGP
jgi:hypothetical protein